MSFFLLPPPNFGMVEEDLYRSGQPNELNFPFLERLKLKTVVYLSHEEPTEPFLNFLDDQEIDIIRPKGWDVPQGGTNPATPISEEEVLASLQFIELFDTDLVRIPIDHPLWL
eukprot:TRINITY_DN1692_c0_g1_i1.p1 TRINITY_DN1692_c0_g1~~TRINITY_DN1692_c0_g1_i1.p1  ORF type:complete len:113 (-),score=27.26 TRINITY_DN1692_c0_g1_i1:188-526(-)